MPNVDVVFIPFHDECKDDRGTVRKVDDVLSSVTAVRSGTIPNESAESRVVEVVVRPLGGIVEEER